MGSGIGVSFLTSLVLGVVTTLLIWVLADTLYRHFGIRLGFIPIMVIGTAILVSLSYLSGYVQSKTFQKSLEAADGPRGAILVL